MEKQSLKCEIIRNLEKSIQQKKHSVVEDFWCDLEKKGTPLIEEIVDDDENELVTFVYKHQEGIENVVLLAPTGNLDLQESKLERLLETNIWYITYKIRNDVRFKYRFSVNDSFDDDWKKREDKSVGDKFCKKEFVVKGNNGDADERSSYVIMPKAKEQLWINEKKNVPKGKVDEYSFHSDKLEKNRKIRIYTPYGYEKQGKPYGILVLTDGEDYLNMLSSATILDNLIEADEIPPIVTIFIDSTETRINELKCSDIFGNIIVEELLPWVRARCNISSKSSESIIGGFSLGGLTASYLGLKYSKTFGNVLSQSGSYWYAPESYEGECWLGEQFKSKEKLPLRFYLNVGVLENKEKMIKSNIKLRDLLIGKGYDVAFEEFKSGHDFLCWGETLANGLISLIGKKQKVYKKIY